MSLRTGWQAAAGTGLLPVFAYVLVAALLVAGAAGTWAGIRWQRGATAINQNAQLRSDLAALQRAAGELRDAKPLLAADYAAAVARMDAIAEQREQDREQNRKHFDAQRRALDALLVDRPDLRSERAGDDVLQHWRRSNAGPGAEPAAAGADGEPDPGVPGPGAADGRSLGHVDRKPRRRRGPVPRLPKRRRPPGTGDARMGADSLALVLRSAGAHRRPRGGVHG